MATLVILRGSTPDREIEIGERTLRLGRGDQNDVVLPDPAKSVSRFHAELRVEQGRFVVVDLNSQNGVWVAGRRVPQADARTRRAGGARDVSADPQAGAAGPAGHVGRHGHRGDRSRRTAERDDGGAESPARPAPSAARAPGHRDRTRAGASSGGAVRSRRRPPSPPRRRSRRRQRSRRGEAREAGAAGRQRRLEVGADRRGCGADAGGRDRRGDADTGRRPASSRPRRHPRTRRHPRQPLHRRPPARRSSCHALPLRRRRLRQSR